MRRSGPVLHAARYEGQAGIEEVQGNRPWLCILETVSVLDGCPLNAAPCGSLLPIEISFLIFVFL